MRLVRFICIRILCQLLSLMMYAPVPMFWKLSSVSVTCHRVVATLYWSLVTRCWVRVRHVSDVAKEDAFAMVVIRNVHSIVMILLIGVGRFLDMLTPKSAPIP